jgi:hypothetical protein
LTPAEGVIRVVFFRVRTTSGYLPKLTMKAGGAAAAAIYLHRRTVSQMTDGAIEAMSAVIG